MSTTRHVSLPAGVAGAVLLAFLGTRSTAAQSFHGSGESHAGQHAHAPMKHQDHDPKHGGIFFMAMDNKHHLEGVLETSGIFRVYLYDAYTHPLPPAKVKQASGTVQVGDAVDAPKIPLALSKDGRTLEVSLKQVKLPFTLTLLMRFPGAPANSKPELFTFPFDHYTNQNGHSAMPAMKM